MISALKIGSIVIYVLAAESEKKIVARITFTITSKTVK